MVLDTELGFVIKEGACSKEATSKVRMEVVPPNMYSPLCLSVIWLAFKEALFVNGCVLVMSLVDSGHFCPSGWFNCLGL